MSKSRKPIDRRVLLTVRFALLAILFLLLANWLQPFAKRYEGKIARDWFSVWTDTHRLRADVIDAFGPDAVPFLLGQLRSAQRIPNLWFRVTGKFLRIGQRYQLAFDWLTVLGRRSTNVIPALLQVRQTNIIGSILYYHSIAELDEKASNEANPDLVFQINRAKGLVGQFVQGNINSLLYSPVQQTNSRSLPPSSR